ncbi:MAG: hypothetical protein CMJ18_04675 [Phycisphaeraceae bacterium]|jgi:hypothetical protein|nr:hypothetical protein [Phycisphaeraceae bacterium]
MSNTRRAADADPANGDYEFYSKRYRWRNSFLGSKRLYESSNSEKMKPRSKREWRERSDATMAFLQRAGRAARTMNRLDREAVKLGVEPTYAPGELDQIIADLGDKFEVVRSERDG